MKINPKAEIRRVFEEKRSLEILKTWYKCHFFKALPLSDYESPAISRWIFTLKSKREAHGSNSSVILSFQKGNLLWGFFYVFKTIPFWSFFIFTLRLLISKSPSLLSLPGPGFPENIGGIQPPYPEILWGFDFFQKKANKSKELEGLNCVELLFWSDILSIESWIKCWPKPGIELICANI